MRLDYEHFYDRFVPVGGTLGRGEFGTVKKVIDKENGQPYAFKSSVVSASSRASTGMLNEMEVIKKIQHKNAIKVVGYYRISRKESHELRNIEVGIVMEMGFCSLQQHIEALSRRERGFKYQQFQFDLLKLARDFLDLLAYMQAKGIAHRDIKPANIVVMDEEALECKLIDFGLSRDFKSASTPSDQRKGRVFVGTPHYAAPEMKRLLEPSSTFHHSINPKEEDPHHTQINYYKSDVYSLGITILELAMLKLPQDLKATRDTFQEFVHLYGNTSEIVRIVSLMLEEKPENRLDFVGLNNLITSAKSSNDPVNIFSRCYRLSKNQDSTEIFSKHPHHKGETKRMCVEESHITRVVESQESRNNNQMSGLFSLETIKPSQSPQVSRLFSGDPSTEKENVLPERTISVEGEGGSLQQNSGYREIVEFECPSGIVCIKMVEDLIVFGMQNGSLGVIFNQKHYLLHPTNLLPPSSPSPAPGIGVIQILNNSIWTGSYNSQVLIWNKSAILREIRLFKDTDFNIFMTPEERIRVIESEDICEEIVGIPKFEGGIGCLCLFDNSFVVGYNSGVVYYNNGVDTWTSKIHSGPVTSVKFRDEFLYTAGYDGMVKKTNLQNFQTNMKFYCNETPTIIQTELFENGMAIVTMENTITFIDYQLKRQQFRRMGDSEVYGSSFNGERWMVLTGDGWLVEGEQRLYQLRNIEGVSCVCFDEKVAGVGSFLGRVTLIQLQ